MKRRLQEIDDSIERYLGQIESADRQETAVATDKSQSPLQSESAEIAIMAVNA